MPAGQPVVLRGLAQNWPLVSASATLAGTAAALRTLASAEPAEVFVAAPGNGGRYFYGDDLRAFNFDKRRVPLGLLLDALLEQAGAAVPAGLYAGALAADRYFPGFVASHPLPLLSTAIIPRLWVGNASTVAPHFDLSSNIAVCVSGRRRFLLFPPEHVSNLYIGPIEHTMAGQPASLVDVTAPDLARFPRYGEALAHAQAAELEPGDAIYVPTPWWHAVMAAGPIGVLVNYWWGQAADASPFEALIHALLAVRDLPPSERAGWAALFDHYALRPLPGALDHIPVAAQGVLGPPGPARSRTIRQFLMGALQARLR